MESGSNEVGGSVAEGFTCEVEGSASILFEDKPYRSACEGLDFYGEHEGKRYCVRKRKTILGRF